MKKPGDMWNWTWALLGVHLLYAVATSSMLHALDAPKIAFGFAAVGCIVQAGLVSLVALSVYGLFTKRWGGLMAVFLAPLLLFPCMIVFLLVTSLIDWVWFSVLHLPKPPQAVYVVWGFLMPAIPFVVAVVRQPKRTQETTPGCDAVNPGS